MPVFHTKTIESILDPVAQQVSRLVIIHEEGEAGHEMPDLSRPVQAVSTAVANLVKVGHDMTTSTNDSILRQDMPQALHKVNGAAILLEEAAKLSRLDPYSKVARAKLIEGSRLILQGTSNVLMVFDESEVRKIIEDCKRVLDYLAVAEVIETLEDLVQFVKDISPCLSKVTKEVERRIEDLTHQVHRDILARCVEQVKTLAPILICSMKIFIQIFVQGGKGAGEAGENRNYLASRMSEEVSEIIRVLQLVTYDEDEWDSDNLTVMKKNMGIIEGKMQAAHDWLNDPFALLGGVGEKSIRQILSHAIKVADRSLPLDANHLRKLSGDIEAMTNSLCELRQSGQGSTPQAESLARNIEVRLNELLATVNQAISRVDKSGIQQPAPTVVGRLEQARRWLEQPGADDRDLGRQAIHLLVNEGYKVAEVLPGALKEKVVELCSGIEQDVAELTHLCREGKGGSAKALHLAKQIASNLDALKYAIETALVDKVVDDFMDIGTPLNKFTEVVLHPQQDGERQFEEKAENLSQFSDRIVRTAKMVAVGTGTANKKAAEAILTVAGQVFSLTPQLINAGRIRMVYPENKAADEHFNNLRTQYADLLHQGRGLVDEVTDSQAFIQRTLKAMQNHTDCCEDALRANDAIKLVNHSSCLARLGNRVLQVAKQEADNSEDPAFISALNYSADQLHSRVAPMVHAAKALAINMANPEKANDWRTKNNLLLEAVEAVSEAVAATPSEEPPLPPYPDISDLSVSGKMRSIMTKQHQPRAPQVFTDEELSEIFQINFAEIFGQPAEKPKSDYKGVSLPKKDCQAGSKPPRGGSVSPVPPPSQFANYSTVDFSAKSSKSSQKTYAGSIRVLPVSLQEPAAKSDDHATKTNSINSAASEEADQFIEQLMQEAETDPKLRELTYGKPASSNLSETYPLVQRPYRTAQDLVIKESNAESQRHLHLPPANGVHKMPERPYRTNEDLKIVSGRSKSADGRLHDSFRKSDPKLSQLMLKSQVQQSSSINVTEDLLNEVVTDKDHHSVKDLVAMMEKNTKAESLNPYVRKWGCDLISPEPHKRNVTYRQEKRQIVDQNELKTFTWDKDDLFKRKHQISEAAEEMVKHQHENHHSPSGRDHDHQAYILSQHTADMDDLLGRRGSCEDKSAVAWPPPSPLPDEEDLNSYPSPMFSPSPPPPLSVQLIPELNNNKAFTSQDQLNNNNNNNQLDHHVQQLNYNNNNQLNYSSQSYSSQSSQFINKSSHFEEVVEDHHDSSRAAHNSNVMLKSSLKKRSQSEGERQKRRFSNNSLHEIDQQIVMIQNEFEAELDNLIDAYRHVQHQTTKKKGSTTTDSTDAAKLERSRKGKHLHVHHAGAALSDDEGTYQALSVVFEDKNPLAPPRPPLPAPDAAPFRPATSNNLDTTDDESEDLFHSVPSASQGPIMMAAHDLHQEVKQWSSKDNDIISAAKKMALLMAKLSQLVGNDANSKRELIACAKAIAEASDEVTRIAKELARECTDKRMRTTLLQVCERIPTIATQLKILSTVKATMLGAQGSEEDREATEMLVGNAQNLMQSVKQTVTAAEAASIKIRTDAGIRLKWVRKQPWYIY